MKYHVVRCPDCGKLSIQSGNWFGCECGQQCVLGPREYPVGKYCLNHFPDREGAEKLLAYVRKFDAKQKNGSTE